MIIGKLGWAHGKTAAPFEYLLRTVFLSSFSFIKALQGAVMALIKPPVLDDWHSTAVHFFEHEFQGMGGALKAGGQRNIECIAGLAQERARVACFLYAAL